MQPGYVPPSQSLLLGPADEQYMQHQRDLRAQTDEERKAAKFRPDGPAMRALRVVAYVMVIIASLAVINVVIDAYQLIGDLREAVNSFSNNINTEGVLGN